MFDMMNMMGKVKEVQARMKEAQENMTKVVVSGESGGGLVKATVNGKKQLLSLDIDPSLFTEDKAILQDLIVAAVNKASDEAEILAKESIRKSTEGILPNIPGMDFSSLMG